VTLYTSRPPRPSLWTPSDLGWALTWTVAAVAAAWVLAAARTRTAGKRVHRSRPGGVATQLVAALHAAWRDARRNPTLWVLFVVVPVVFIITADAVTPDESITLTLTEYGRRIAQTFPMPHVHGATMAPIAVGSLAALVGLFTMLDSRDGDRRAALAGLRRCSPPASASSPARFGRVGGVFVAFLLPFLDIGIVQSPMPHPEPTTWSQLLPGYGGSRVLLDAALTNHFDETRALLIGSAWLVAAYMRPRFVRPDASARSRRHHQGHADRNSTATAQTRD